MLSTYTLLKFLHIVGAIIWLGGISALTLIYARLTRTEDRAMMAALAQLSNFAGRVLVGPAAALTLIAGIATAATAGYSFGLLWISWGFAGIVLSIALGATFIRRVVAEMDKLVATSAPVDARLHAFQRRLTVFNLVNVALLLSTVWAMVAKPML